MWMKMRSRHPRTARMIPKIMEVVWVKKRSCPLPPRRRRKRHHQARVSYTNMHTNDHTWTSKFVKWQEYTLENDRNGQVPCLYKTPDGFALGKWQHQQYKLYKDGNLAARRLNKLEQNHFPFKKQKCTFRHTPDVAIKELDTYFNENVFD
jgi:hypothetical protein